MIEIVLGLIIIALLAERAYKDRLDRIERKNFVNALKSKNAQELRDLQLAENTKIDVGAPTEPDLVPVGDAPDTLREKAILRELGLDEEANG